MSSIRVVAFDCPPHALTIDARSKRVAIACSTARGWLGSVRAQIVDDGATQMRMLVLDVEAPRDAPRMQERPMTALEEAVDVHHVLDQRQRRVRALEVAGAIAVDAMPQDQVLRAGRRADRVGLHEAESIERAGEVERCEQRALGRIAA